MYLPFEYIANVHNVGTASLTRSQLVSVIFNLFGSNFRSVAGFFVYPRPLSITGGPLDILAYVLSSNLQSA